MAPRQQQGFFGRHDSVLLYVPNIIGYIRVAAAFYAFAVATSQPLVCVLAYFFSFVCDELDGRFARMLRQTSTMGAVLDMVTDRLATTGLLIVVALSYPQWYVGVIVLIFLDVFSHWFQMYASLALGESSHKDVKSRSWLVRKYYSSRVFMGYCCICCEVLYLALYATKHSQLMSFVIPGVVLPKPPPALLALLPELSAFVSDSGLPIVTLLSIAALPGFFTKQVCNWFQLRTAAQSLVRYDLLKEGRVKAD